MVHSRYDEKEIFHFEEVHFPEYFQVIIKQQLP